MTATLDLAQIQHRRDTAGNWTLANTKLAAGEIGVETDTSLMKMGDGTTLWNSLGYLDKQIAAQIHSATAKATPVDADELPIVDSAASNVVKKLSWANIKATLNAIFTTKGDILVATGAGTPVRLPVGANGTTPVADSAQTTGIKWTAVVTAPPVADSADGFGYIGTPQNAQSANYTIVASDAGKDIFVTATGKTITIDSNANLPLQIGAGFTVTNDTGVTTSIAITADTLVLANSASTGTRTLAPYGVAVFKKITATKWICSGNGLS